MRSPCHHSVQVAVYIINIRTRQASNPLPSLPEPRTVALRPFAADAAPGIRRISVRVGRPAPDRLVLEYELAGELHAVIVPDPATTAAMAGPTDGLWRHTCMEAFVRGTPGPYLEFNLAPSGQWAAYRFSGYREGMTPLTGIDPPRIELRTQAGQLLLSAEVELPTELAAAGLQLGIAAVVESQPEQLSYWAVRHAGARPDFHHPDSFAFEI